MRIVGITECHEGVVQNHLAAMRLSEAAKGLAHEMRLEVHEAAGVRGGLSAADISDADLAIVASDRVDCASERFDMLPVLKVSTREAITEPRKVLGKALELVADDGARAFIERKMFSFGCGQCVAAYLASAYGFKSLRDAMLDETIRNAVRGAMNEGGKVLERRYHLDPVAHGRHIEQMLARLANPWVGGELKAVTAQPRAKLGRNERLVRPLRGAVQLGLPHECLVQGVAAVFRYADADDTEACEIQARVRTEGIDGAVVHYLGDQLTPEALAEIVQSWTNITGQ